MVIIEARLVYPGILLFDKSEVIGKVEKNIMYWVEFLDLDSEIENKVKKENRRFNFTVRHHRDEKFKIFLGTKVKGYLNLKYQQKYKIKFTDYV